MTLQAHMLALGRNARAAALEVAAATSEARTNALRAAAAHIDAQAGVILAANNQDLAAARAKELPDAFVDRLTLNAARISAMASSIETIARQEDPIGRVTAEWTRPNGLSISRVRTPLGVIGMIFESRPNVAADAGALALRAGNAIILRGGADGATSVEAIVAAFRTGLRDAGFPEDALQAAPSSRDAVGAMLAGLDGAIDVLVPRGGKSLVARVQQEARVPVLAHLEGVCHTYVHAAAREDRAVALTVNGKMRRVSVCGATETLLIDRAVARTLLPPITDALRAAGCTLRGDAEARAITTMETATEDDWRAEYLAPVLAVRVVATIEEAIAHIRRYGSQHTDCIVTEDTAAGERFLREVDSAIVLHNASTQFADGGEFGFGGEIGIATGKLHARGPVGAEQLTTFKYIVRGAGQTRP